MGDSTFAVRCLAVGFFVWTTVTPLLRSPKDALSSWVIGIILSLVLALTDAMFSVLFWTHMFFGCLLMSGARIVYNSDGGPLNVPLAVSVVGVVATAYVLYGDITKTTYLAHLILDTTVISIFLFNGMQRCFELASRPTTAARIRTLRELNDPFCYATSTPARCRTVSFVVEKLHTTNVACVRVTLACQLARC